MNHYFTLHFIQSTFVSNGEVILRFSYQNHLTFNVSKRNKNHSRCISINTQQCMELYKFYWHLALPQAHIHLALRIFESIKALTHDEWYAAVLATLLVLIHYIVRFIVNSFYCWERQVITKVNAVVDVRLRLDLKDSCQYFELLRVSKH